uniref:acetyl-coenzyme A synthetase N-terminal domain-containing protein n=1 Tax=Salmonella enterica TaxID=28901 RepID=UPI0035237365
MSEHKIYPVSAKTAEHAFINRDKYQAMYQRSISEPENFWAQQASEFLHWSKPWDKVLEYDYPKGQISWFAGGKLNVSVNCLDRHLATRGEQTAIIWEGDN